MVNIRLANNYDIENFLEWNEEGDDFLCQWSNYHYPLTKNQIEYRIGSDQFYVFSIESDDTLVGTIQLFKFDNEEKSAKVGCFLIDPNYRNKGIGKEAICLVTKYAFEELKLCKLQLAVFDFNKSAIKCYEKCGFIKCGQYIHQKGWIGYNMEIYNKSDIENKV